MPFQKEQAAFLVAVLDRDVAKETSPRRQASILFALCREESPSVQAALFERIRVLEPEAFRFAVDACPVRLKGGLALVEDL